jgi:hypothetical protein
VKKKEAPHKGALTAPLDPAEWDFRKIPENQLENAIYYEYARSCAWIVQRFTRWHEEKLSFPKSSRELTRWNGLTVKGALEKLQICEADHKVIEAIGPGPASEEENQALTRLYLLNPLFPTPFLNSSDIAGAVARVEELMPLNPKPPPFRDISYARGLCKRHPSMTFAWDDPVSVEDWHDQGVRKFEIVLDLRYSRNLLKKAIGEWVDRLKDAGVKKFPIEKGQKARPKWFRLRELGAYRFSQARISFNRAQDFLQCYRPANTSVQFGHVLPDYKSPGAWSDAVKSAEKHISKLFPAPISGLR